jgi:hypothetical protein
MKNTSIKIVLSVIFAVSVTLCFSQERNDSIERILSSKNFTLEEEYIGDWGGYINKFSFILKGKDLLINWKNPQQLKNGKDLDVLLSISELDNFGKIFTNCSAKIKTSKNTSTEHILYKFQNEDLTFIIDDRFTMECNEDFKAWKEMLLSKGEKQKNK